MSTTSPLERLRSAHRHAVVTLLAAEGPLSRADLARGTGLSRTTVSNLVSELVEAGEVVETSDRGRPHKGGSGRPPVLVALAPGAGAVAAVDLGHRHLRVAVADLAGNVLAEVARSVDVDADGASALDVAADAVRALVEQQGLAVDGLRSVVMCVPAPLDRRSSRLGNRILRGWEEVSPAEELGRRLGLPVVADNDANLGALAEHARGAARGSAHAVFLKVASGVGSGIILGGRLHRGTSGRAGEIGHVQVGEDGAVCRCGNRGCLETLVAAPRLIEVLRPAYDEPLSTERVLELEAHGDAGVRRVLSDAGRVLGRALADLCNVLNPEVIVVGGSLGGSTGLRDGIRAAIDRYAQPDAATAVRVVAAELGPRAELVGALTLATSQAHA